MALNIELFKKVRERIAAIPESYDQNYWKRNEPDSPCGSAACLAGETIICDAPTVEQGLQELESLESRMPPDSGNPMDFDSMVPIEAAKRLGLRRNHHQIFLGLGAGWPEPFRTRFIRATNSKDKADIAVAYLDHIIETGKVLE